MELLDGSGGLSSLDGLPSSSAICTKLYDEAGGFLLA